MRKAIIITTLFVNGIFIFYAIRQENNKFEKTIEEIQSEQEATGNGNADLIIDGRESGTMKNEREKFKTIGKENSNRAASH